MILRAVDLRAKFSLSSMDALHEVAQLVHGCETFLANDERLGVGIEIRELTLRAFAATGGGEI